MQNKPKNTTSHSWPNFGGLNIIWRLDSWSTEETKDSKVIEGLIKTLGKLGISSIYYEDFDCDDRWSFIKRLNGCAFQWRLAMKRRKKRLHKKDWIRFDDVLETRLLVNSGRHLQSHQLTQALKLVEPINKCQYPSFFLVDSS